MASDKPIAVIAALVGNSIIAVGKLTAGLIANSASMLAEAAHSFSDVGNQCLLLVGIRRAKQPVSEKYPFGTSRSQYFWPFLVAVLLFGVAGGYSIFEGIEKLRHPHDVHDITLSLYVLGGAFIVEAITVYIAIREAVRNARADGAASVKEWLQDNRDASLLTVIIEDGLALASLPIAGAAITLSATTGDSRWDAGGSLLIGVMLMGFAFFLGNQIRRLLIGVGINKRSAQRIRDVAARTDGIRSLQSLQSMHLGPRTILLGAEVVVDPDMSAKQLGTMLQQFERDIQAVVPGLQYVFLEAVPDGGGPPMTAATPSPA